MLPAWTLERPLLKPVVSMDDSLTCVTGTATETCTIVHSDDTFSSSRLRRNNGSCWMETENNRRPSEKGDCGGGEAGASSKDELSAHT